MSRTQILNHQQIQQKLNRMAWQIYEANYQETELVMAGINGNGYKLAERLAIILESISTCKVILSEVVIDKKAPFNSPISVGLEEAEYSDKVVILVDDVLNSGKTMIYGVKHFLQAPVKKINTAALVDRKHHRFPIRVDYAGLVLSTSIKDHIQVELGNEDSAFVD